MLLLNREPLYQINLDMHRGGGLIKGIRRSDLVKFAKKVSENSVVTDCNVELWILQYLIEEENYSPQDIVSLSISESDIAAP